MTFRHVLCADMCSWSLNYSYVDGVIDFPVITQHKKQPWAVDLRPLS